MILWYCLESKSQQLLIAYQREHYRKGIKIVEKPMDEIPVDYAKEMAQAPSRSGSRE